MYNLLNRLLQLNVQRHSVPPVDTSVERLFNCIKSIEKGSSKISAWSLSIIGGSLLAILSNDYLHPSQPGLKMIYLLFIVGWIFIGKSFYNGKKIIGKSIATELNKNNKEALKATFEDCNEFYSRQLRFFNLGLLIFGIWLLLYLLWWVFGDTIINLTK